MDSKSENSKVKVLVIDDDADERRMILNFLSGDSEVEICTFLTSGFDVVSGIKFHKPDVVVTDFLAKDVDKSIVLDKINSSFSETNRPKVIVTSSLESGKVMERAFSYGIDYYIRKPVILSLLKDAILLITKGKPSYSIKDTVKIARIKNLVRSLGMPVNILGYTYIVEAIKYMVDSEKTLFLGEVYKMISKTHETSVECVEVSIRNAIKKSININNDNFKKIFKNNNAHPSNSVFISTLREFILSDEVI